MAAQGQEAGMMQQKQEEQCTQLKSEIKSYFRSNEVQIEHSSCLLHGIDRDVEGCVVPRHLQLPGRVGRFAVTCRL